MSVLLVFTSSMQIWINKVNLRKYVHCSADSSRMSENLFDMLWNKTCKCFKVKSNSLVLEGAKE